MYWALYFVTHQVGISLFRLMAVITRNIVLANGAGMLMLLCTILVDGFVIIKSYIHPWIIWSVIFCTSQTFLCSWLVWMTGQLVFICAMMILHVRGLSS